MRLADGANALGRPSGLVPPLGQERDAASELTLGGVHKPGVKQVAQEFEALLLQQLVAAMREGTSSEGEDGPGKQLVDHYVEEGLARHIAKAGGLGLGRYLERETGTAEADASRSMGVVGAAGSFGHLMRPGGVDALERLVRFGPVPAAADPLGPVPAAADPALETAIQAVPLGPSAPSHE